VKRFAATLSLWADAPDMESALPLLAEQASVSLFPDNVRLLGHVDEVGNVKEYPAVPEGYVLTPLPLIDNGEQSKILPLALPAVNPTLPSPCGWRDCPKCPRLAREYLTDDFPEGTLIGTMEGWRPLSQSDLSIAGHPEHSEEP